MIVHHQKGSIAICIIFTLDPLVLSKHLSVCLFYIWVELCYIACSHRPPLYASTSIFQLLFCQSSATQGSSLPSSSDMHPLNNHPEPNSAGVTGPSMSLMSVQAAPSTTPHLSSEPNLTQTSTPLPSTNILPTSNFVPQVQPDNTRTASSIPHFQCHHADCRRVFARKTSLTNHLKAHNNIKSRSIRRMRRERERHRGANLASASASNSTSSSPLRPPLPQNVTSHSHSAPLNNGRPPTYGASTMTVPAMTVPLMTSTQLPQHNSLSGPQPTPKIPVSSAPLPSQLIGLQSSSAAEYVLANSQAETSFNHATIPRIAPPEVSLPNNFPDDQSAWAVPFPSPTAAAEDLGLTFASPRTFGSDTSSPALDMFFSDPVGFHTISSTGIDTNVVTSAMPTSLPLTPNSMLPPWYTMSHSLANQRSLAPFHVVPNDVQNMLHQNSYQAIHEATRKASDSVHNEAQQIEGAVSSGNASTEGTPLTPTGVLGTGTNGELLPIRVGNTGKLPASLSHVGSSDAPSSRHQGKYTGEDGARNPGFTNCNDGDFFGFETMPDMDFEQPLN